MRPCTRGDEPELLARHGAELTRDYVMRRSSSSTARFEWRQREGRSLLEVVRGALALMTDDHCSYCDGHPIDDTGEATVDHFRPKALFAKLAYAWTNLFLTCSACNHAKGERWDELLLRPDDSEFRFERYFECDFATGQLAPAPIASSEEQERARRTIEILRLNRAGTCVRRLQTLRWLRQVALEDDRELAYRYLLPIFRAAFSGAETS